MKEVRVGLIGAGGWMGKTHAGVVRLIGFRVEWHQHSLRRWN